MSHLNPHKPPFLPIGLQVVCQVLSLQFGSLRLLLFYLLFIAQLRVLYLLRNHLVNRVASQSVFLGGFVLVIFNLVLEFILEFVLIFVFWVSGLRNDVFITDFFHLRLSSLCCIVLIILFFKMCSFHHQELQIVLHLMVLLSGQKVNVYANNSMFQNLVSLSNFCQNIFIEYLNFLCGLIINLFVFSVNVNFQHREIFIIEFYL